METTRLFFESTDEREVAIVILEFAAEHGSTVRISDAGQCDSGKHFLDVVAREPGPDVIMRMDEGKRAVLHIADDHQVSPGASYACYLLPASNIASH